MNEKRAQILESAITFFSEKGYFYTSMQDIASDCGISKGSLYKIFDSKEDLLIQLFEYNNEKMFQRARSIQLDDSLPRREMLKKLIIIELEGAFENKDFFNIIYKSLPGEDNQKIFSVMKNTRAAMVEWHKNTLMRVYGLKAEKKIWDLAITFQGVIKEFIFLVSREGKQIDFEQTASYIADLLEALIHHLPEDEPVLTDQLMADYQPHPLVKPQLTKQEEKEAALSVLKTAIERGDFDQKTKKQLLDSVDMLAEELQTNQPRIFLINALITYLKKVKEIQNEVKQIDILLSEYGFLHEQS